MGIDVGYEQFWYLKILERNWQNYKTKHQIEEDEDKEFELCVCREQYKNGKTFFSKWESFHGVVLPYTHRLRLPHEIVIEFDRIDGQDCGLNCETDKEKAVRMKEVIDSMCKVFGIDFHTNVIFWITSHGGRSPHFHYIAKDPDTLEKLFELVRALDCDKHINFANRHMVRMIGAPYFKNAVAGKDKITYCSSFSSAEEVRKVYCVDDIKFPFYPF